MTRRERGNGEEGRADPVAILSIRVQPRASGTELAGRHADAIKIRIAAPPVDGAANEELVRFLAERLDVPLSAVAIMGGATSRTKHVRISGVTTGDAVARLT